MPTQMQWHELQEKLAVRAKQPVAPDPLLHSAAVKAEQLVGDTNWDTFLTQLQGIKDMDQQNYDNWLDQLKRAVGDKVPTCQMNIAAYEARLALVTQIMTLPGSIVRAAHDQS